MEITARKEADLAALRFAMNLSLFVGVLLFALKVGAYLLTGSAAILSDAAESVVHVVAVAFAAYSLRLSFKPADETHPYGHAKISFFSAGFEGSMIAIAAVYIIYVSISKWIGGLYLENLGIGTGLTALAAAVNGALGWFLLRTGRKHRSLILEANGKHVLTDCWTSIGVIVALVLTLLTDWLPWDPIVAILIALNILRSGIGLVREGVLGLMDTAEPDIQAQLEEILERETSQHGIEYHDLRHRNVGIAHWIEVHLLFPQEVPIGEAHRTATMIEQVIEESLEPAAYVSTHLEAIEDHREVHSPDDGILRDSSHGIADDT